MNEPSQKPTDQRPSVTSHEPPKTSTQSSICNLVARDLNRRDGCRDYTDYTDTTTLYQTTTKVCRASQYPQACMHYRSAISAANDPRFNPVTCSANAQKREFLGDSPALTDWKEQHTALEWRRWMRRPEKGCQRDEWPPSHFWQGGDGQYVRYNVSKTLPSSLMPEHTMLLVAESLETLAFTSTKHY